MGGVIRKSSVIRGTALGSGKSPGRLLLVLLPLWTVYGMSLAPAAEDPAFTIQGPDTLAVNEQASYALTAPGIDFRDITNVRWQAFGPAATVLNSTGTVATVLATDTPGEITLSATLNYRPFGQFGTVYSESRRIVVEDKLGVRVILSPSGPTTLAPNRQFTVQASVENSTGEGDFAYFWDFGDGTRGSQETDTPSFTLPPHAYEKPGSYVVTVEVIDEFGAEGSSRLAVNVHDSTLEAALLGPTRVPGGMRQAFPLFVRGGDPGYTCSWFVVPPAPFSTASDPCGGVFVTFPNSPGDYAISVGVVDALGASATAEHVVQVTGDKPLGVVLEATPRQVNIGRPVTATVTPTGGILTVDGVPGTYRASILWGDGNVTVERIQPGSTLTATHYYAEPGIYTVAAVVFDAARSSTQSNGIPVTVGRSDAYWKRTNVAGNPDNLPLRVDATPGFSNEGSFDECQVGATTMTGHSFNQSSLGVFWSDVTGTYTFDVPPEAIAAGELTPPLKMRVEVSGKIDSVPCPSVIAHFLRNRSAIASSSIEINSCIALGPDGSNVSTAEPRVAFPASGETLTVASRLIVGDAKCLIEWTYKFVPGS